MSTIEKEEGRVVMAWSAWPAIEEEGGGLDCLNPVWVWHRSVYEERARDVVECAESALGAPVLG